MRSRYSASELGLRAAAFALCAIAVLSALAQSAFAATPNRSVLVRDITTVQGVRDNLLVGYGLVVGLSRTGDSQQTYFTVQTLANAMQRMGVLISPGIVEVKNVAAVFITATLPPFSRPGSRVDVTVSSVGDAKSLEGGVLLMSALHGPDGQVYAEAQGPLVVGGYSAGGGTNAKQVNTPTVGVISDGGIVERDTAIDLHSFKTISLLLRNPDFTTARQIADAINQDYGRTVASALDNTRIDIEVAQSGDTSAPALISRVQNLSISVHSPARIVVNERTGTIVLGGDVKLTPVSVIHGTLSIEVVTSYSVAPVPGIDVTGGRGQSRGGGLEGGRGGGQVRQDGARSGVSNPTGGTGEGSSLEGPAAALVPQTNVNAGDSAAQTMRLDDGANVDELVNGLHAIGTTARDVVAILQAIKAEGGLQAELEVQ